MYVNRIGKWLSAATKYKMNSLVIYQQEFTRAKEIGHMRIEKSYKKFLIFFILTIIHFFFNFKIQNKKKILNKNKI